MTPEVPIDRVRTPGFTAPRPTAAAALSPPPATLDAPGRNATIDARAEINAETFAGVIAAAEAGAVGLTIGRDVWQHEDQAR